MKPDPSSTAARGAAWLWLLAFLAVVLTHGTVNPLHPAVMPLLAASGWAIALMTMRAEIARMLGAHKALFVSLAVLAVTIAIAEVLAHARGVKGLAPFLPPPVWLVLCLAPLAALLLDETKMRFAIVLFAAVCAWHFLTMPIEAVTGRRMSWQPIDLFPRPAGPLHFQAAGLAWQVYYFAGFFLPVFYLAWGPASEGRIVRWPRLPAWGWVAVAMAWLVPAISTQSRSAFAGTLAAGLLALLAWRRPTQARAWLGLGLLLLVGLFAYAYLFSENKSGMDLRWAYFKLYLAESLKWPQLLAGHGFTLVPNEAMFAKGFIPLEHSHNDLVQTLYSWGTLALASYLVFAGALVRLVWRKFVAYGRLWPVCALVAFVPSTVTDLGFQNFEKAAFLVLLTSWCIVFSTEDAPGEPTA